MSNNDSDPRGSSSESADQTAEELKSSEQIVDADDAERAANDES